MMILKRLAIFFKYTNNEITGGSERGKNCIELRPRKIRPSRLSRLSRYSRLIALVSSCLHHACIFLALRKSCACIVLSIRVSCTSRARITRGEYEQ